LQAVASGAAETHTILRTAQHGLAMAPRSNWKGYIKLSLVSACASSYPITSAPEKVRFNTLNRATANRWCHELFSVLELERKRAPQPVRLEVETGFAVPERGIDQTRAEALEGWL
jgi:DNA end-binding protein Ku